MPNDLYLPASDMTPEVDFAFSNHRLSLTGESYPENASAFYGPIISGVEEYMNGLSGQKVEVDVRLAYFNSASTRMLFNLFDRLNNYASQGFPVAVNWFYDEEDDTILEFGQEMADDFQAVEFRVQAVA